MTQIDPETAAVINDEKMTDTEMAMYLIRLISFECLSEDPQIRENWVNINRRMTVLALQKIKNPFAKKILRDALKELPEIRM